MNYEERMEEIIPNWRISPKLILKLLDKQQNLIKQYQEEDNDRCQQIRLKECRLILGDVIEYGTEEQIIEAAKCLARDPHAFNQLYRGFGNHKDKQHTSSRPGNRREQRKGKGSKAKTKTKKR